MAKPPPPADRTLLALVWRELAGLTRALTDLSFREFITPRIVRTLYFMSLIGAGLAALAWMFSGFKDGLVRGVFTLVTGPVAFLVYILTARVALEFMLAVFRIADNTEQLREKSSRREP